MCQISVLASSALGAVASRRRNQAARRRLRCTNCLIVSGFDPLARRLRSSAHSRRTSSGTCALKHTGDRYGPQETRQLILRADRSTAIGALDAPRIRLRRPESAQDLLSDLHPGSDATREVESDQQRSRPHGCQVDRTSPTGRPAREQESTWHCAPELGCNLVGGHLATWLGCGCCQLRRGFRSVCERKWLGTRRLVEQVALVGPGIGCWYWCAMGKGPARFGNGWRGNYRRVGRRSIARELR